MKQLFTIYYNTYHTCGGSTGATAAVGSGVNCYLCSTVLYIIVSCYLVHTSHDYHGGISKQQQQAHQLFKMTTGVRWTQSSCFFAIEYSIGGCYWSIQTRYSNVIKGHHRPTEATAGTGSSQALAQEIATYETANQGLYAIFFH